VFKHGSGKDKVVNVTAYDQLRYAKAKDSIVIQRDTVTTLTNRMCNYLKFQKGTLTDAKYVLATDTADDKTWLDIVYSGISETLTNIGKWYCLRDEVGTVCLRDLNDLKLNLILGDGSLCYDYEHEKSIDDNFYNLIKIYVGGKATDTTSDDQVIVVKDETSMEKYGPLQYFEATDKDTNASQAKAKAKMLLSLYNHEQETLSLECLGNTSIRAGSSFYAQISDISLNKRLIVKEVTHSFIPTHTMSLEVSI
ncbi:MAG: XkdQ/YqbQ family protein, partial [Ruminiclostridium sp.]